MSRCLLFVLCCLSLTVTAFAKTPPIHFTASVSPSPAHPGEVVTVTVNASVDKGWHVYSVVPADNGPSATEIVSLGTATKVGPTTEDTPQSAFDPNFQRQVAFHQNTATFARQFRVMSEDSPLTPNNGGTRTESSAPPLLGAGGISETPAGVVTLHYQTCNDHVCLPPTDVSLPVALQVAPGSVRAEYAGAKAAPPQTDSGGLALFLLAAIGAGLLALITPCVFPLIPITLTNFVKQANGDKAKLVRLSAGYALGIVALYVALGAVVTATLGATGINNIAANPWVNLGIFVVFVVFAFSFFETIQLTLPANLTALQATAKSHGGIVGLALLGVTFVLASFTCTAPFLGTLLVTAASGERFRPLLGMLVFALSFVSPFLVFAAFPQWIAKIPKGGLWLARVKAVLGFLELAAALKFLSNADQVWNWRLLTQPVLLAAWAVIFVCAALYLWGTLRFGVVGELEPPGARVPKIRAAFAALFAFFALYCFWGLAGRPIGAIAAFLPPAGYGGMSNSREDGLPFLTDYNAALAQAKAEGKPLFVDFTGVTCTNCRWNEKNVFPRGDVQAELSEYVRVQLYTDRPGDAANQHLQLTKFGDVALPLYAVVNPQTEAVVDKYAGTITDAPDFTRFLSQSRDLPPAPNNRGAGKEPIPARKLATLPSEGRALRRNLFRSKGVRSNPPLLGAGGPLSPWAAYSPQTFAAATHAGKPIIIDFTAAWCANCKEIEHDVFENPAVTPTLASDFTTLRADLTNWSSPASVALQKQYSFGSLPTIVILRPDGTELKSLRITGRFPLADFQKRMQAAVR